MSKVHLIKKGAWLRWAVILLLLACNRETTYPLDPVAEYKVRLVPPRNQAPVEKKLAVRLRKPAEYRQVQALQIAPGAFFQQFEYTKSSPQNDPRFTLRTLLLSPQAFGRLQIFFSDASNQPLSTQTVLERPEVQVLVNGTFFGRVPAGDVLGLRCRGQGRSCAPGIYYRSEKITGKNLNLRYSLVIDQKGKAGFFRGGLEPGSGKSYRLAMGGGLLLFDQQKALALYQAVGKFNYKRLYSNAKYNHTALVAKGQGGYPERNAPRTAAGILPDGSLLLVCLGEGKYRFEGGASPARMAWLMKELGAVKAVMFDGGGAPQMAIKNLRGQMMIRSYPEITRSSNYLYNYAFVTLKR